MRLTFDARGIWLKFLALLLVVSGCSSDSVVAPNPGSIRGIVKAPLSQLPIGNVQMSTVPGTSVQLTNERGEYTFPVRF